eukprot:SAG31_NODE_3828_length_3844_cov_1.490788_3_plen_361_part_00
MAKRATVRSGARMASTAPSGRTNQLLAIAMRSRPEKHAALRTQLEAEHQTRPGFETSFASSIERILLEGDASDDETEHKSFAGFCAFVASFVASSSNSGAGPEQRLVQTTLASLAALAISNSAGADGGARTARARRICLLLAALLDATADVLETVDEELWDSLVAGLISLSRHSSASVRSASVPALAFFQCPTEDVVRAAWSYSRCGASVCVAVAATNAALVFACKTEIDPAIDRLVEMIAHDRVVTVRTAALSYVGLCPSSAPAVIARLLDPTEPLDVREPAVGESTLICCAASTQENLKFLCGSQAELLAENFDALNGAQRREIVLTLTLSSNRLHTDLEGEKLAHANCWYVQPIARP